MLGINCVAADGPIKATQKHTNTSLPYAKQYGMLCVCFLVANFFSTEGKIFQLGGGGAGDHPQEDLAKFWSSKNQKKTLTWRGKTNLVRFIERSFVEKMNPKLPDLEEKKDSEFTIFKQ